MRKVNSKGQLKCNTCLKWQAKDKFKPVNHRVGNKTYVYWQGDCIPCFNIKNRAKVKDYKLRNRKLVTTKCLLKRAELRKEFLNAYGGKCACCKEARFEFLTLDHIHGRALKKTPTYVEHAKLKRAGWPKNDAQILCFNCNSAKGVYGSCPHTWKRDEHRKPLTHTERIALYKLKRPTF